MNSRLAQIEKISLSEFSHYRPADRRVDEKEGGRDGHGERPASTDERYSFRERAITSAQAALRKYHHQVENFRDELTKREQSLRLELDERYAAKRDQIHAEFKDRIDHVEQTIGPTSSRYTALREAYQRAVDWERRIEAEVGRPLRVHLVYWYALIMVFVALIEIPINRFAFELYFAETPALSLMIALGIGVALMLLAHFAGTWLKRSFGAPTLGQKVSYGLGIAMTAALMLPTIYLIALLRQHYVRFIEAQNISFAQLLEQRGIEDVAREVITTDLGLSGVMLLMINILVIGIAIIVSVARHDAHPDYEKAKRTRERTERRFHRLQARYDKSAGSEKAAHDLRINDLDKQQERLERELEEVHGDQQACEAHTAQMLQRVALHLVQRFQAYEEGNLRARSAAAPKSFGQHDEQTITKNLLADLVGSPDRDAVAGRGIHAVQ